MDLFNLPHTARVNRVIPKNAFDSYITAKQKKLFTDLIARITWTHKLSTDTVNLEAKDIQEIQVFRIGLKVNEDIQTVLDLIDKAIPYHIVFVIDFDNRIYLSTSAKHPHPVNSDKAVIDWTFRTAWFLPSGNTYTLQLKKSLDAVHHDLCAQLSGKPSMATRPLHSLIAYQKEVDALEKEIARLTVDMARIKQFNKRVELNLRVKELKERLRRIK